MLTLSLLFLSSAGLLITPQGTAGDPSVLCFAKVNEETGHCEDYLEDADGQQVSKVDCCLNIKYGFKQDNDSPCEACRPAKWSEWSEWTPCTVSCTEGVQERRRVCIGQDNCKGEDVEVKACKLQDCCPQNGGWSQWTQWSPCSVTCESGTRQRTRQCNSPSPSCGGTCVGDGVETEACNTLQVCPTHGSWGSWGPWNPCSSSCMQEGSGKFPSQVRRRLCNNPQPSLNPPGRFCQGSGQESRDCTSLPFCAVDGQWGAWKKDSECSVTCGIGRVTQKRLCDNPAPRHGGKTCAGSPTRNSICNTKTPCPIDGEWTEWGSWSQCGRIQDKINCRKKVGTQRRSRNCEGTSHGGEWCPGDYRQSRHCYDIDNCFIKSLTWSEWSEWGLCSSPCGKSERTRYRECLPDLVDYPEMVEAATGSIVEVFFWGSPKVKCDAINGETAKVVETSECKNVPTCT